RNPSQARSAGGYLPEQRGAALPRPVLRSTARRGGHRGLAAAGAGRCHAQESYDDGQAGVATAQPRSPPAQVAASDQVPTLLIWGDHDRVFPKDYAVAFQELIPGAKVVIIADCGHLPHVEKGDAFAAELEAFIGATRIAA